MVEGGRSDTHKHTSHLDLHSENYTMKDHHLSNCQVQVHVR